MDRHKNYKILVIVPSYNEAENLPSLLHEIRQLHYDVIVIDDSSSDSTAKVASESGVPVLSLAANLGIGGAVQTGFKYAVANDYDIVVQIDGDGQHDPVWVKEIIQPLCQNESDCAIGSRYVPEQKDTNYKTPFARRMGMYFSTSILYVTTGLRINDTTSSFRALNRNAFEYFANHYPVDHPEAEALFMLHKKRFRICEVPIKMRIRAHGESLFNFTKAFLYPLRVVVGFIGLLLKK